MNITVNQRILWQIFIWGILFFGVPFIVLGGKINSTDYAYRSQTFIGVVIMIILNLKFLFPRYYSFNNFKKYVLFSISSIFSIRIISVLFIETDIDVFFSPHNLDSENHFLHGLADHHLRILQVFIGFVPVFVVTLTSTLYETSILANKVAQETALLKAEKLETELKFLKSQINPHFLFNSLNNIYTLTVLDPTLAGKNLLKLSEMLRYLLYECNAPTVHLGRELTYLENYIDLFSLKDDEPLNISFDAKDVNKEVMIAPLLLIPFVENAFKHSQIEDLENGWINISIIGDDNQLYFEIKNSIPKLEYEKDSVGGIGLQNVQRQLELLYPNKHQLKIDRLEDSFKVYLTLYL